jgi:chemotaxis protein CheC
MLVNDLSEMERDALTELVNIAVSGAASRLRTMVGSEVRLTVPIINVLSAPDAAQALASINLEHVIAVRQAFEGRLSGQAMLLFNAVDAQTLVRAVLGEEYSDDDYAELRDDTLGEVGNVLLLGLLATVGSMLGLTFQVEIPTVEATRNGEVFPSDAERVIMLIHVDFSVGQIQTRGYFALALGLGSLAALRDILAAFLKDIVGDDLNAQPSQV